MKNYCKMIFALSTIFLFAFVFNTGFVVNAAANPVSLSLNENDGVYEVDVYLKEDIQMNAFQFKLEYDKKYLNLNEADFSDEFISSYNDKKNALLSCNRKDSRIMFLGVQTDDNAARQKSGRVIACVEFSSDLTDVAEIAKALNSVVLTVEVLEGNDGNIVPDDDMWSVHIENGTENGSQSEDNVIDEDDLREDKYYSSNQSDNDRVQYSNGADDVVAGNESKSADNEDGVNSDSDSQESGSVKNGSQSDGVDNSTANYNGMNNNDNTKYDDTESSTANEGNMNDSHKNNSGKTKDGDVSGIDKADTENKNDGTRNKIFIYAAVFVVLSGLIGFLCFKYMQYRKNRT